MIASLTPLADALLRASLDGLLFSCLAFGLSRLLKRLPLACVWLWRLTLLKFALGLLGVGIALHRDFEEVNLRFYVRAKTSDGWRRGVVFIRELVPRFAIAWISP